MNDVTRIERTRKLHLRIWSHGAIDGAVGSDDPPIVNDWVRYRYTQSKPPDVCSDGKPGIRAAPNR